MRHERIQAMLPALSFAAAASVGVRMTFGPGLTVGLIVSVVLLPVWVPALRLYRHFTLWASLGTLAVVAGIVLTALEVSRESSATVLLAESLTVLGSVGAVGVLLWARAELGAAPTAVALCAGMLASVVLSEPGGADAWKFSWSVPVYLLVLAAAMLAHSRMVELIAIGVLSLTTIITDSRSVTAFLLLSAALTVWQMRPTPGPVRPRPWWSLAGLGLAAASAYSLFQSLIFEGALGEAVRTRSLQQVETAGSLIAGGRPELGASIALIRENPFGLGAGVQASSNDVWIAKGGMAGLNYDADNGYVERYMFGTGFEVHSMLGDLWIRFGIVGAIFVGATLLMCLLGLARHLSARSAPALMIFTVLFTVWNTFFSPYLGSYRIAVLALLLVAAAAPRALRERTDQLLVTGAAR